MNAVKSFHLPTKLLFLAISVLALWELTTPVAAQEHPLVSPFPYSSLAESDFIPSGTHQLALGVLQRNRNRSEPENSLRVEGAMTKLLYRVSQEYSGADAYLHFMRSFKEAGFIERFSCEGRACGSSNDWANDVFGNRILYGPSRSQYFAVYQADAEADTYVSLYIVTRGNRQTYAYLEVIEESSSQFALASDLSALGSGGFVTFLDLIFENDRLVNPGQSLSMLVDFLVNNPNASVFVVANLFADEPLVVLEQRSTRRAESVAGYLVDQGVSADNVISRGVGPLSPGCGSVACRNRIEVILQ